MDSKMDVRKKERRRLHDLTCREEQEQVNHTSKAGRNIVDIIFYFPSFSSRLRGLMDKASAS